MIRARWIVALALLGCASGQPGSQASPSASVTPSGRRTIELRVPVNSFDAQNQVVRGVRSAGREVTNQTPGLLRIGPFQLDPATSMTLNITVVSDTEFATRIVVSGSYRVPAEGIDETITESSEGRRGAAWAEMRRIADSISRAQ